MSHMNPIATDRLVRAAERAVQPLLDALTARADLLQARILRLEAEYYRSIKENGQIAPRTERVSNVLTAANARWERADERRNMVQQGLYGLDHVRQQGGRVTPWPR